MRKLLAAQEYRCALTGRTLTPENCTGDHIVPIAQGGEHNVANVQLVVAEANRAKGTLSQSEFIALCVDVARRAGA